MARIVATFSNGQTRVIKNSRRHYSHAWRWWAVDAEGKMHGNAGFCQAYARGMKSAAQDFNFHNSWAKKDRRTELKNFEFEVISTVIGGA